MADTTPQETWPDGPDPVDDALAQLGEPHHLLAEALLTLRAAQATGQEMDTTPAEYDEEGALVTVGAMEAELRREARHRRLIDEAATLTRLAEVASKLVVDRHLVDHPSLTDADLDGLAAPAPADEYEPQGVNGVRFTAELRGRYMGLVGGREWLYVAGCGFLNISGANQADRREGMRYELSGRVVSVTPEHVLCVTDGGGSVALPRVLITESPDE